MRILALDVSPASTGLAWGDATSPPHSWSVGLGHGASGSSGAAMLRLLRDTFAAHQIDLCAVEAPLMTPGARTHPKIAYSLMGLAYMVESYAALKGVRCLSVPVQTWRKAFIGHGRPEKPKQATMAMCDLLGWDHGGTDDRADAMGVWAWAHLMHGSRKEVHRLLSKAAVRKMEG